MQSLAYSSLCPSPPGLVYWAFNECLITLRKEIHLRSLKIKRSICKLRSTVLLPTIKLVQPSGNSVCVCVLCTKRYLWVSCIHRRRRRGSLFHMAGESSGNLEPWWKAKQARITWWQVKNSV